MRRCIMVGSVVLVCLMAAEPAWACSCRSSTPQEAAAWADVVFAGRVVETMRDAEDINEGHLFATIDVDNVWKGRVGQQVVVRTAPNSAQCGAYFEQGKHYLVYAIVNDDGVLSTNSCSRTKPLERAEEDIFALEVPFLDDDVDFCGGPTNVAALQAMFFVFLVVALRGFCWRRR